MAASVSSPSPALNSFFNPSFKFPEEAQSLEHVTQIHLHVKNLVQAIKEKNGTEKTRLLLEIENLLEKAPSSLGKILLSQEEISEKSVISYSSDSEKKGEGKRTHSFDSFEEPEAKRARTSNAEIEEKKEKGDLRYGETALTFMIHLCGDDEDLLIDLLKAFTSNSTLSEACQHSLDFSNTQGNTPLILWAEKASSEYSTLQEEIISLFLKLGADILACNKEGQTAFSIAALSNKLNIMKLLVKNKTVCPENFFLSQNQSNSIFFSFVKNWPGVEFTKGEDHIDIPNETKPLTTFAVLLGYVKEYAYAEWIKTNVIDRDAIYYKNAADKAAILSSALQACCEYKRDFEGVLLPLLFTIAEDVAYRGFPKVQENAHSAEGFDLVVPPTESIPQKNDSDLLNRLRLFLCFLIDTYKGDFKFSEQFWKFLDLCPRNSNLTQDKIFEVVREVSKEKNIPLTPQVRKVFSAARVGNLIYLKRFLGDTEEHEFKKFPYTFDINYKDEKGNTLLHIAVKNGHKEIFEYLIDKGADPSIENEKGRTPGFYSSKNDYPEVTKLLKAAAIEKEKDKKEEKKD